jgi:hypothetical protein
MRITILNGSPDSGTLDDYLQELTTVLQRWHQVTIFDLRDMDIKYCTGCFGCWVKKPGECVVTDASDDIRRAVIHSDLVMFASPLKMGFVSALLKKTMDKLLPLIHPYFAVDQNEAHHRARYERYPLVGLLLDKGPDADDEDVAITTDLVGRMALNMKSRLAFAKLTQNSIEEVAHAADSI